MLTPGVSSGTRTMDCWRCGEADGSVLPMTMRILQRSPPAPEVHHLRPLMTHSPVASSCVDAGADVGGVRAGDVGLGHGERRADRPLEERGQPAVLLLLGAEQVQDFHVSGVGRRAVDRLGSQVDAAAGELGQRRVVQHAQRVALARQEEVPQPALAGLGLQLVEDRRERVAPVRLRAQPRLVHRLGGVDRVVHEGLEPAEIVRCLGAESEVHARQRTAAFMINAPMTME